MIRKIEVRGGGITIVARLQLGRDYARFEVERVRDALADRLQAACANLPYADTVAINRVKVR